MAFKPKLFSNGFQHYTDQSIRRKIAFILVIATTFALMVASAAVLFYETRTFKPRALMELKNQTQILGEVLIPSLQFQDSASASDYLATLRHWNQITAAAVYDAQGRFVTGYHSPHFFQEPFLMALPSPGSEFHAESMTFCTLLKNSSHEVVGYLWLKQKLLPLYARLPQYGIMFSVLVLSVGVVTGLVGLALKRSVLEPILSLTETTREVFAKQDYSLRAKEISADEIGDLTRNFNQMLVKIGQRERSLRQSEEKFSKAFLSSPIPLAIVRLRDYAIIEMNASNLALLGMTVQDVVGHNAVELGIFNEEQFNRFNSLVKEQDSLTKVENEIKVKDGGTRTVQISVQQMELENEPCMIIISDDVTERKQVEENLRQSQKMEAIGLLAGGVAHDFNNLLTAIMGYGFMAVDGLEPGNPLARPLNQILLAAERAEGLTRQLLAYSRKQVLEFKVWDLNKIVANTELLLARLIHANIELVFRQSPVSCPALVDRGQVEQVILNLAVNARDAMPDGGRLILETSVEILEKSFDSHLEVKPGTYAVISVTDSGMGMSDEVKAHLFEPFFTTKEVGKGTGLGLSVVYGIVKQCGGTLSVLSEPGLGTTFRIYFPSALKPVHDRDEKPVANDVSVYRGDETILIVEDEPMVLDYTLSILEKLGYRVLTAINGNEALKVFSGTELPIQLVVSDFVMPIMGGRELVDQIHSTHPQMPVLFVSGYIDDGFRQKGGLKSGESFLQKPFHSANLARAVRELLDGVAKQEQNPSEESHHDQDKHA
jgi:PAS domain S-box-containing protein